MSREYARSSRVMVESPAAGPGIAAGPSGSAANSLLSVAIASSDSIACSSLRHMLLQTGLVREIRDWASARAVELRQWQDVPDVVFLGLSGTARPVFPLSQRLAQRRPSVIIGLTA